MTGWFHREHYSVVQEPYLSTDPQTWSIQDQVKLRLPAVIEVAATCQFLASHCGVPGGGSKPGKLLIKTRHQTPRFWREGYARAHRICVSLQFWAMDTTFLTRWLRTSTSSLHFATVLGDGHHVLDEKVKGLRSSNTFPGPFAHLSYVNCKSSRRHNPFPMDPHTCAKKLSLSIDLNVSLSACKLLVRHWPRKRSCY